MPQLTNNLVKPTENPKRLKTWEEIFYRPFRDVLQGKNTLLSLHERDVLTFIFCRTRVYKKMSEKIPLRHFEKGVYTRDGVLVCGQVVMSQAKLLESLRHLEGKGIIEVTRRPPRASIYRIKEIDEIEDDVAFDYIERNQPKLLFRFFDADKAIRGQTTVREILKQRALEKQGSSSPRKLVLPPKKSRKLLPTAVGNIIDIKKGKTLKLPNRPRYREAGLPAVGDKKK